jgi:hypothetical protein
MFFKNDNNQFQILIRLLHRLYKETATFEEVKDSDKDKAVLIRLNLKVL